MIIVISVGEDKRASAWLNREYKTKEQIQEEFDTDGIPEKVIAVKDCQEHEYGAIMNLISDFAAYEEIRDDLEKFLSDIFQMGMEYGEKLPKISL